ncbi:MAG: N-acetylmuramoyl-L-alanine amidase [Planctomycetales bacterium]|nr:N-acetylmuramoyl-L-alanine amidase [Planctomycetales bacterium]
MPRPSRSRRAATARRSHCFEPLEPRIALAGDVIPGLQIAAPAGDLTGKIVYTSAGHGWQWNDNLGRWATDRGDSLEIVEDFGNQDQMTYFADFVLRAGGTVVPMRPVGHQLNEVVLDNDSAGVTFAGAWSNSSASIFYDEDYGATTDAIPYRYSSISATETAIATYTPNIPEAGFYPVYTWVRDGTDRTNQLYRIHDSAGGVTEIRVDHRMVGKGWVYLGTYHFDEGTSGSVVISNQSTDGGSVVIADAIRFGNGMGDVPDGPSGPGSGVISGYPREDENSLMWLWRSIGQGTNPASVIGTGNVSAPSLMAEYMNSNNNPFGTSVYIGFHSNAAGGRGAVGLYTSSASQRTPHQEDLALFTGRQINQDMQALNGQFEHDWSTRTTHTYNGINFGEINEGPNAEMDMTIIEVAFHDQAEDAELMRDPKVREQLARSTYEGVLEYFDAYGGLTSPASQPSAPIEVQATANLNGDITVAWAPGAVGVPGGAASAYRVYVSRDGYGYQGYVEVAANAGNSYTFAAADLDEEAYFFKVVAVNDGGESPRGSVVAAQSRVGGDRILIVDGFDRNERSQNERYPYAFTGDGLVDRVRTRYNNSFDYAVPTASAVTASGAYASVDTVANELVAAGAVNLADYDAVIWILGEESTADDTFNAAEQTAVSAYLAAGGKLFATGSEIGWDLDQQNNGRSFYNDSLHADYVSDDANSYSVSGLGGSIFEGIAATFDNGQVGYDVNYPDVIAPAAGATAALNYGTGGTAAIQYTGGAGEQVVLFGFPFESILDAGQRTAIMAQVLAYFSLDVQFTGAEIIVDNDAGSPSYTETGAWSTAGATGYNGSSYRFATVGQAATATWNFTVPVDSPGEVFVQYRTGGNRATSAAYSIDTGAGIESASTNQSVNDLTWVSLGTFDFQAGARSITLDAQTSAGGSVVIADAVRIVLAPATNESGDFDGDTIVNGGDFLAWQRGYGIVAGATAADGDANGDGVVDGADLNVWQGQFGSGAANAATAVTAVSAFEQAAVAAEPTSEQSTISTTVFAAASYRIDQLLQPVEMPRAGGYFAHQREAAGIRGSQQNRAAPAAATPETLAVAQRLFQMPGQRGQPGKRLANRATSGESPNYDAVDCALTELGKMDLRRPDDAPASGG